MSYEERIKAYEREKQALYALGLSAEEFTRELVKLAKKYNV